MQLVDANILLQHPGEQHFELVLSQLTPLSVFFRETYTSSRYSG